MKRGHLDNLQNVVHPTVVGIVFWMEKSGYLTCYVDREDRRNKIVEITEQATLISQKMQEEREAQEQKLLRGLTEREVGNLYRMLSIIRKNV